MSNKPIIFLPDNQEMNNYFNFLYKKHDHLFFQKIDIKSFLESLSMFNYYRESEKEGYIIFWLSMKTKYERIQNLSTFLSDNFDMDKFITADSDQEYFINLLNEYVIHGQKAVL